VSVEGGAYLAAVTEDDFLRALPLTDRLRIAAVDFAVTGAPRALVEAVWLAIEELPPRKTGKSRKRARSLWPRASHSSRSSTVYCPRTRGAAGPLPKLPNR
jgi:hypothetical protein